MELVWVIEADESPVSKPFYFFEFSRGRCFLTWTDEIDLAKTFLSFMEAQDWARDNRLHCGFRVRAYPNKIQIKRRV